MSEIPMPPIQKIKDIPLSNEQTKMATSVLDSQRLKENEDFRSYQLMQQQAELSSRPSQYPQHQYPPYPPPYLQQPQYPPPSYQPPQSHHQPQFENHYPTYSIYPIYPVYPINQSIQSIQHQESFPWTQPPLPEFLDPKKSIDLKLIRKTNKKDTRCYTCKPRGKIKKHMINTSSSGKFVFHHDMHKRPVIIMTPARHIENIYELTSDELIDLTKSLKEFALFWNIDDYQLSFNMGKWQNHEHFHCKIRISEKVITRMRRDHFERIKRESNYT